MFKRNICHISLLKDEQKEAKSITKEQIEEMEKDSLQFGQKMMSALLLIAGEAKYKLGFRRQ